MKPSVTDVTDPAKLSRLAGSTSSEAQPVCKLNSVSFACLYPGWISPFVTKTDSQGSAQEGCGCAGEQGRCRREGQEGLASPSPVLLSSRPGAACPHLWEPMKQFCAGAPILRVFWHACNSRICWGTWDQHFHHTALHV